MEKTTTQELLAQAEKICAQRNVRLTPQRLEVLRLMSLQDGAISAYDLLDLLREAEPQAKPPTVYRALDFLLEQGFVHKVESTNSYVLCHLFDQPTHTSAMFICDRCGAVKEECAEGVEDIMRNKVQIIQQFEQTGSHANRYDVTILVTITTDIYGDDVKYTVKVVGLDMGRDQHRCSRKQTDKTAHHRMTNFRQYAMRKTQ